MNKPHPKYRIKAGDTINSLTLFFGVEATTWISYHNDRCRLEHLIRDKLPKGLTDIYLLPELRAKANVFMINRHTNLEIHAIESDDLSVPTAHRSIYPHWRLLDHTYGVRMVIEKGQETIEIRYNLHIRYIQEESEDSVLLLIHRASDVYINDELPTLCMDELAYHTGKVFYPFVVEVDKRANWIGIRNYQQIQSRWEKEIVPYVRLRYSGEIVNRYLESMDEVISSKDKLEAILKNELSIKILFKSAYRVYSPQFDDKTILEFAVGDYHLAPYQVSSVLSRTLNAEGFREIRQEGIGLIPSTGDEMITDESNQYSSYIQLYNQTNHIREVWAQWSFMDGKRKFTLIFFPLRYPYGTDSEKDVILDKKIKNKK